jgi:hypothetical protein
MSLTTALGVQHTHTHHVHTQGSSLANYSVYAPALTRSTFHDCAFTGGLSAGLRFGYGWINTVEGCRFSANGLVALHMADNINNVNVVDNLFEGNSGLGIVINEGVRQSSLLIFSSLFQF